MRSQIKQITFGGALSADLNLDFNEVCFSRKLTITLTSLNCFTVLPQLFFVKCQEHTLDLKQDIQNLDHRHKVENNLSNRKNFKEKAHKTDIFLWSADQVS